MDLFYFISSLPMLAPGGEPRITYRKFIGDCAGALPPELLAALEALTLDVAGAPVHSPLQTARDWRDFEVFLRNTAARHRAARLHRADIPQVPTAACSSHVLDAVQKAFAIQSPVERERVFDGLRWQFLEDLEGGHYYDQETLAIYALKLLLLERIGSRKLEPGLVGYNSLVDAGVRQAEAARVNS